MHVKIMFAYSTQRAQDVKMTSYQRRCDVPAGYTVLMAILALTRNYLNMSLNPFMTK